MGGCVGMRVCVCGCGVWVCVCEIERNGKGDTKKPTFLL